MQRSRAILAGFGDDDCGFLAGGIAYQLFFALIPVLALVIGVFGLVYGPERAAAELVSLIARLLPAVREEEARAVRSLVDGRAVSFGLGLFGTVLSAAAIHSSLDTALAAVRGRAGKRRYLRGQLEAAGFLLAIAALAVASFAASYGIQALADLTGGGGAAGAWVALALSPLAGLLPGLGFFYLVFRLVPRRRPARGVALRGALVSAVLWEVAKLAFAGLTRTLGTFAAYGALAFAAGLLTWIYVTAAILLVGAEYIKTEGARA